MIGETRLPAYIQELLRSKNSMSPLGLLSICSSNPIVIEACISYSAKNGSLLLIESTCNQVNQFGGYTRMNPEQFASFVSGLAEKNEHPTESIVLGGDHLGPEVWKDLPSKTAIENAAVMIRQYIRAGYKKIHIDASMGCSDDLAPLPDEIIFEREAELCKAAVEEVKSQGIDLSSICFVVGTEVPSPGGSAYSADHLEVSSVDETEENINRTRETFFKHGLEDVWDQTIAFVIQPGVEYGDDYIHPYDRDKVKALSNLINSYENLVYEAHSTDYQSKEHLREMVEDHFAILKVGPALTYAMREAIMSLELIEKELFTRDKVSLSNLCNILDQVMCEKPEHWDKYYSTDPEIAYYQRRYSLLDRSRYYWANPEVNKALKRLLNNLSATTIPLTLLSQYLPEQHKKVRSDELSNSPTHLIQSKVNDILANYTHAVGSINS